MKMKKILTTTDLILLETRVENEIISRAKMVELINHAAFFKYEIEGYQTLDDSEISLEKMSEYVKEYLEWDSKEYSSDFEKGMSKPNPPNYYRANND